MALYPVWSNSLLYAALIVGLVCIVGLPAALWFYVRSPYNTKVGVELTQPVIFDHRHHVGDDGIDCRYCHYTVERSKYAGVPAASVCMGCHAQIWRGAALLAPVRDAFFNDAPLVWRRVNSVPDFVFFNHAIHVDRGVGCVTCHGRVDEMASASRAEPLSMQWCLSCHRDPERELRPLDHVTDMTWTPNERIGRQIQAALDVHPPTTCTGCHR